MRPRETDLLYECDKLFAIGGFKAVKRYIDIIEYERTKLGVDQELTDQATLYRKEILNYYKKMKI